MALSTGGVDVGIVRSFLKVLREGRLYIARITRSGRNGRYAYLLPPRELLEVIGVGHGARFSVSIHSDYVDYIVDENGEYTLVDKNRGAQIRFPLNVSKGYVVIEPLPGRRGFRVYY